MLLLNKNKQCILCDKTKGFSSKSMEMLSIIYDNVRIVFRLKTISHQN